jgi:hypothetical protein
MKRLLLYLFISSLLISGCSSSDDDDMSQNLDVIVGLWKYVKDVEVTCSAGVVISETVESETDCGEEYSTLKFNLDGTFTEVSLDGNCDIGRIENGTYRISDGKAYSSPQDILWLYYPESETFELGYRLYELSSNVFKFGESNQRHEGASADDCGYYYYELVRVE